MSRRRRNKGGRPPYVPTDEDRQLVERLAGIFVSQEEIARTWLKPPIDQKTLRRHYRDELDNGVQRVGGSIKARILRAAENGSLRAMIYLADRLCPEFAPTWKMPEGIGNGTTVIPGGPGGGTTIIIRGGLPDEAEPAQQIEASPSLKPNGANGSGHSGNGAAEPEN